MKKNYVGYLMFTLKDNVMKDLMIVLMVAFVLYVLTMLVIKLVKKLEYGDGPMNRDEWFDDNEKRLDDIYKDKHGNSSDVFYFDYHEKFRKIYDEEYARYVKSFD